jgi:hypothetical protein
MSTVSNCNTVSTTNNTSPLVEQQSGICISTSPIHDTDTCMPTSPLFDDSSPLFDDSPHIHSIAPGRALGTFEEETLGVKGMAQCVHPFSRRLQPNAALVNPIAKRPFIAPGMVLGTFEEESLGVKGTAQCVHPFSERFQQGEQTPKRPRIEKAVQ